MDYKIDKLITYMLNQLSYATGCIAIMETELTSGTCIDITSIKHLKEFNGSPYHCETTSTLSVGIK